MMLIACVVTLVYRDVFSYCWTNTVVTIRKNIYDVRDSEAACKTDLWIWYRLAVMKGQQRLLTRAQGTTDGVDIRASVVDGRASVRRSTDTNPM